MKGGSCKIAVEKEAEERKGCDRRKETYLNVW